MKIYKVLAIAATLLMFYQEVILEACRNFQEPPAESISLEEALRDTFTRDTEAM